MRKLVLGIVALVVSLALLAGSATVAQAASLTVFGEQKGTGHGDRNSFVFHEKLTDADGVHVGRNRVEVTRESRRSFSAKALFRFQGGKIRVAGPARRGNRQVLPITGGRGRYHGISGLLRVKIGSDISKYTFNFSR